VPIIPLPRKPRLNRGNGLQRAVATVIVAFVKKGPSQKHTRTTGFVIAAGVDQACFNLALKGV
jgi:hypothetical protein